MNIELLRAERKKRGISQEALARGIGYKDRTYYCRIERGYINITVESAKKIIGYLGLSEEVAYKIFLDPNY